jgi:hypothetical protein
MDKKKLSEDSIKDGLNILVKDYFLKEAMTLSPITLKIKINKILPLIEVKVEID